MTLIKGVAPVSAIVPCYRCASTVTRAVDSIVNQSLRPAELILVDDASNDETIDMLKLLKRQHGDWVKIIELAENVGAASARNAGWNKATQPYVAFLDADDTWHTQKIEIQYGFMRDNPDVVLSGHVCKFTKDFGEQLAPINYNYSVTEITAKNLIFKTAFSTPSIMLKRQLGFRFNENQRFAEDAYLWQLIAFSGFRVVRIQQNLAFIYKELYGESGLSSYMWQMELAELTNFLNLFKAKKISAISMLVASVFSIVKFARRLIIKRLR